MAELNAKCSIISAMNQKNSNMMLDSKNMSIEGSLLSRFDLIFELVDLRDPEFDLAIVEMIFMGKKMKTTTDGFTPWTLEQLRMHVLVAKDLKVETSQEALEVLKQYYLFCSRNVDIEDSRKTMRFFQSLERLTVCHAKLLMRTQANFVDAITAIMLMEASWSFGHLIPPKNIMKSSAPVGPSQEYICQVLTKLNLEYIFEEFVNQQNIMKRKHRESSPDVQDFTMEDIEGIFDSSPSPVVANFESAQKKQKICSDEIDDILADLEMETETGTNKTATQSSSSSTEFCLQRENSAPSTQKSGDGSTDGEISFRSPPATSTQFIASRNLGTVKTSERDNSRLTESNTKQQAPEFEAFKILNAMSAAFLDPIPESRQEDADKKSKNPSSSSSVQKSSVQTKPMDKLSKFAYQKHKRAPATSESKKVAKSVSSPPSLDDEMAKFDAELDDLDNLFD